MAGKLPKRRASSLERAGGLVFRHSEHFERFFQSANANVGRDDSGR